MNEIPEAQEALDRLVRDYLTDPEPEATRANGAGAKASASTALSDEEIISLCRKAKNAAKFASLYDDGDTSGYDYDDSRADQALASLLAFYTDDPGQLERLFSGSALGQRSKWRNRADYRRRTIQRAIDTTTERYSPPGQVSSSSPPLGGVSDDDSYATPEIKWFHELGEPKPREYIIEQIGAKGYPIVAFGAGGVAKSFAMLAAGIAIASASGVEEWLGLKVLEHGHVLYLDFELDIEEQHRRVRDLCAGLGILVPKRLAYLSGVGISTDAAFEKTHSFVKEYEAKAVIIDSVGLAMMGDMDAKDVLGFYRRYIDPLRRVGVTPFLVDHEGKLQAGEKHKDKSPFGSAYKAWAARSVLQFELEEYDEKNAKLDLRVRQTKANFGPKIKPFGVSFTFEEKKVSMETRGLADTEMMDEERVPVRERILAALSVEPATNAELQRIIAATEGTVRNNLAALMHTDPPHVEVVGQRGHAKVYGKVSSSPPPPRGNDSDDTYKEAL